MPDQPALPALPAHARFNTDWDEQLFFHGPASIFCVDHKGWLKVDPERTREIWLVTGPLPRAAVGHFVLTDSATGLCTYLCTTHPDLALRQPRGTAREFSTGQEAWAHAQARWQPAPAEPDPDPEG